MAWNTTADSYEDSITGLFSHLCDLHCKVQDRAFLTQPLISRSKLQKLCKRTLYDTLFGYLIGGLRNEEMMQLFSSRSPSLWMLEYIYKLRSTRHFDKANRLEELFTEQCKHSDDMKSILKFLILMADTAPPQESCTLGHQEQMLPNSRFTKDTKGVLPMGPLNYGDTQMHSPDFQFYMHYPPEIFQSEPLQKLDCLKICQLTPGENLAGNGLFNVKGYLNDTHETLNAETLFGGLVQGRVHSVNAKLELPELPDDSFDSGLFEVHSQSDTITSSKQQLEDKTLTSFTSEKSLQISSSFLSFVPHSQGNDSAFWEEAFEIELSNFYAWESRGIRGPIERPYMTELGGQAVDEWHNMRQKELTILCPSVSIPSRRCLSQVDLVKDVLNLLLGIPSSTFLLHRDTLIFSIEDGIYIIGITPESLAHFVREFLDCASCYLHLRQFAAPPLVDSFYNGGVVYQAFKVAIRRVLHHYEASVLTISDNINIMELKFLCHHLFEQMSYLKTLCKCDQTSQEDQFDQFPKGVQLLSYIYRETLESSSTQNFPMMLSVLQTTCGPYTLFLQEWVFHGLFRDPYGEFMIKVNDGYLQFKDKNYWTQGYTLETNDGDSVPLFLSDIAKNIFICGKSINLLKVCCPQHFLCRINENDIPRISVTFSEEELSGISVQCQVYVSKMQQISRQLTLSRLELEEKAEQRKHELLRRAKEVATRELQRIQDKILQNKRIADAKKREQFKFLKDQMERDLQRKAEEVKEEAENDKRLLAILNREEEALTEKELELEKQAREELVEYYSNLTEAAALREQKALWHIRRSQLNEARMKFLENEELAWKKEMEQFPEGHKLEDVLPSWARGAETQDKPIEVHDEEDSDLPMWARRVVAKAPQPEIEDDESSVFEEDEFVEIPRIHRGTSDSQIPGLRTAWQLRTSSINKPSIKLSEQHSVLKESEESPTKAAIQTFPHLHASKESDGDIGHKPHVKVSSEIYANKESVPQVDEKIHIRMSNKMSATKETEGEVNPRPHLKRSNEMSATTQSTKTKEDSFPKMKRQDNVNANTETTAKEWKVKKANMFGHVSQLSNMELVIAAPRLKRPEQIYASLESDFKDYGIKPRIRMSKVMSATSESTEVIKKSGIKMSKTRHMMMESEAIDYDALRLQKFRQQNVHGHSSDSSIQRFLYGDREKMETETDNENAVQKVQWIDEGPKFIYQYDDKFDMFNHAPAVDLLASTVNVIYGSLGDYGISQRSGVDTFKYMPLPEILKRSIITPLTSQISLVNDSVINYFFVDLQIMEHFKALRRYLLMEDGDFAQILSDILFEKLATSPKVQEVLNPVFLNAALTKAFKSSMNVEDSKGDNLSFVVRYRPDFLSQTDHSALDCLELTYMVKWPLNILLTDSTLRTYSRIFSFMLKLKRTVWVLKDVWHRLKRDALVHQAGNAPQFRQLQLHRQEMHHLVQVMQGYIANQIIFVTWNEFREALKTDVKDLDDLHRVHSEYLEKAIFRCLLNPKAAKLMEIIQGIFTLILKFHAQLISSEWYRDHTTGQMAHSNFKNMVQCYRSFKEYSTFLFKVVNKLVLKGYQPHLQELLLRLNFNNYYKDT